MASLTFANIETRCANQLRLPTSNSTEMTRLDALINEVYRDIYAKHDWWWLVKRTVVNTTDDSGALTVSCTNASTTVLFSTAPTGLSFANFVLITGTDSRDSGAVYRVSTHASGTTTCTLDAAYTGATSTTATGNFYRDTYALPSDYGKGLFNRRYGYAWPFEWLSPDDIFQLKNYDQSVGKPQSAAVWDFTTTGDPTSVKMLVVHPYPDNTYRMEIHYKQTLNTELSGSTRPLIPDDYVQILIYGTLARGYPIFLNDTERGLYFQNLFNDLLALMVSIQRERSGEEPQLQVADQHRRFYSRGRVRSGNVNLGSFFDRLPYDP